MSDTEERIVRITRDLANRHHQGGLEVDLGHVLDLDRMLVQVQKTIKRELGVEPPKLIILVSWSIFFIHIVPTRKTLVENLQQPLA